MHRYSQRRPLASAVFESIVENSMDAVIVTDRNGDIVYWNDAATQLFGYSATAMLGKHVHDILPTYDLRDRANAAFARFKEAGTGPLVGRSIQVTALKKGGDSVDVQFGINVVEVDGERFIYAFIRDISQLMQLQRELEQQASTDALTGILNRRAFLRDADTALGAVVRHKGPLSMLMLDIDHFKRVNDAFGHDGGDTALREFTTRVRLMLRSEDLFGRVGGEEFCVVLPRINSVGAILAAEKVCEIIRRGAIEIGTSRLNMTVSIGVASLADSCDTVAVIQRRADEALYDAKRLGRDRVIYAAFNPVTERVPPNA